MYTELERLCRTVDAVLSQHRLTAQIAGGYIAPNGLLLSLNQTILVPEPVRRAIQIALQAEDVKVTVGVLLVSRVGWQKGEMIEGEFVEHKPFAQTVDVLDLIALHQQNNP